MKRAVLSSLFAGSLALIGCGAAPEAAVSSDEEWSGFDQESHGLNAAYITCRVKCDRGKRVTLERKCGTNAAIAAVNAYCADKGGVRNFQCRLTQKGHPTCGGPGGGGGGDPHMFTFDGLRYEFQPKGEFVYATDNETFNIQVRTEQWGGSRASVQTAIVTDMGDVQVGIYAREQPTLRINGKPAVIPCANNAIPLGGLCTGRIDFDNGGWVSYDANAKKFAVVLPDQISQLDVVLPSNYMNTQFFASYALAPKISGIIGNVNGDRSDDLTTRDGKVMAQPVAFDTFYKTFANSWRVLPLESTFTYAPGQTTLNFTDYAFPGVPVTVKDLPQVEHDAALAACKAAGVPVDQLEDCTLDAALMGHSAAIDFLTIGKF